MASLTSQNALKLAPAEWSAHRDQFQSTLEDTIRSARAPRNCPNPEIEKFKRRLPNFQTSVCLHRNGTDPSRGGHDGGHHDGHHDGRHVHVLREQRGDHGRGRGHESADR